MMAMGSGGVQMKNGRASRGKEPPLQERFINCCFSFTIQRDLHGIPTLIAGACFMLIFWTRISADFEVVCPVMGWVSRIRICNCSN